MALSPKLTVNKKTALMLLIISLMALCILKIQPGKADPKTITVPDDYPTITEAIGNATEGDTIFVKKGNYVGPINQKIVIDKALSIVGENAESTIINLYPAYNVTWILTAAFFSYSDAIAFTADDCKLLNLTVIIANPGGYISVAGNRTQIKDNNITTGSTTGVTVNGSYCNITDNVMGGCIQLNGSFSEVSRNSLYAIYIDGSTNIIKDNVCEYLGLDYSTNNVVSGNRVATSSRSYSGISLRNSNNNFFYRNHVSGFSSGFRLWFSSGNTFTANTIADSQTGTINFGGSSNNTFYLNNFVDNMYWYNSYVYDQYTDPNVRAAFPNMTVSTNFWDNGKEGNHWGDYNGSDVNGNGIGDTPSVINENNQDNYPLVTSIDISSVTVELPEWASPSPSLSPTLTPTDNKPLPITLLVAVAIIACVFGFGLIVNLLTGKKKKQ